MTGITPDLTTLGKVIGGGLPVGAFGGRREIMAQVAPLGPVYQAGTLSGNPVAVAVGLTLKRVRASGFYEQLTRRTRQLTDGLQAAAAKNGVPFSAQAVGGMFGQPHFRSECPQNYAEVMSCDVPAFNRFFHRHARRRPRLRSRRLRSRFRFGGA